MVVPNWQSVISLASMLVLAGSAIFAGAEPALVLFTLIVGVGFTVIPILAKAPRLPSLPKPQVALPAIGPPNIADRLPREHFDTDKLRQSTEAMVARWRENTSERAGDDSTPDGTASN
jgi:hypothetical protein